jgi:predicted metal-dependent peptidase
VNAEANAEERIRIARTALVARFPYFAPVAFLMSLVETPPVGTMAVDHRGRLYYNPAFVQDLTDQELVGLIWHEVNHLVRDHPTRGQNLPDEGRRMVAADLEINDDAEEAKVTLPTGEHRGVYPEDYGLPGHLTMEEYYYLLPEGVRKPQGAFDREGSGEGGEPAPWELPDDSGTSPEVLNVARRQVAELVLQATAKKQGHVPAGLARWARDYLNPKVDWRRVLKRLVKGGLQASQKQKPTYNRVHRRSQAYHPYALPGHYSLRPRVAVVVDTSGSMGENELSRALAEIRALLKTVRQVTVYSVDAQAHNVQKVFRADQIRLFGGGGTRMGAGIEKAQSDKPDLIIVLTDGETDWPANPPRAPVVIGIIGPSDRPTPWWAKTVRIAD